MSAYHQHSRRAMEQAIITEDSDLIPFGAKRVLYKMDKSGRGGEIQLRNLASCEELSFAHWTPDMLLNMCVLSGCDYLPSLPGFGIKRAHDFVRKYKTTTRLLQMLKFEFSAVMPPDYLQVRKGSRRGDGAGGSYCATSLPPATESYGAFLDSAMLRSSAGFLSRPPHVSPPASLVPARPPPHNCHAPTQRSARDAVCPWSRRQR